MTFLVLDLDNTVWDRRKFMEQVYIATSERLFHRRIDLFTHPVTGEPDITSHLQPGSVVMRTKVGQILAAGESLRYYGEQACEVRTVDDLDYDEVNAHIVGAMVGLGSQNLDGIVHSYLDAETLGYLAVPATAVAVATLGRKAIQTTLLDALGYTKTGTKVDLSLSAFGDKALDKQALLAQCLEAYIAQHGLPRGMVYIGDSEDDMRAVRALEEGKKFDCRLDAIGVMTGGRTREELRAAGADLVVETLEDRPTIYMLRAYIKVLPPKDARGPIIKEPDKKD